MVLLFLLLITHAPMNIHKNFPPVTLMRAESRTWHIDRLVKAVESRLPVGDSRVLSLGVQGQA